MEELVLTCSGTIPPADSFISEIQRCRKSKDLTHAKHLYMSTCEVGLETNHNFGNSLVAMFVECKHLPLAQHLFNKLDQRNELSWTYLIQGYHDCDKSQHAIGIFDCMQDHGVLPSKYTFVALLKACTKLRCVEKGQRLHEKISQGRYECDTFIGSALVDMYAKCGLLEKAQEVFDQLPIRNVVSWTTLISAYVDHGYPEKSLYYLKKMQEEGTFPDVVTYCCALKACGSMTDINNGHKLHSKIAKLGLEIDTFLGVTLMDMYIKCDLLPEAHMVFHELPSKDVVSWNAIIVGYAEHGLAEEAFSCLKKMQTATISPNAITFINSLRACSSSGAVDIGRKIHAEIIKENFERDIRVANTLIDLYAKLGMLAEAQSVFDEVVTRDVVTWTALISGYSEQGLGEQALCYYEQMLSEKLAPDKVIIMCALKACTSIRDFERGKEIYRNMVSKSIKFDHCVLNTLVDLYATCGCLAEARQLFDELPKRDVVSWNALVTGYSLHGCGKDVLDCLEKMQLEGLSPNAITFICILKACCSLEYMERGQEVHIGIVKQGFEKDPYVGSMLVEIYAKNGWLQEAQNAFDNIPVKDAAVWNALISAYADENLLIEVFESMNQMQLERISPNATTYVSSLCVCGVIGCLNWGQQLHIEIVSKGMEGDIFVGNGLVDMYAKCNLLLDAQAEFNKLVVRTVVSWTALTSAYLEYGLAEEASKYFQNMQMEGIPLDVISCNAGILIYAEKEENETCKHIYMQMQEQGILPNKNTFASLLKSVGNDSALRSGKQIHAQISASTELVILAGLIDMYAKSGSMIDAQMVFDSMVVKDIVSYNILTTGYARHGKSECVACLLGRMGTEYLEPDDITFLCALSASSHAGLIDVGKTYFEIMAECYNISPSIEHYNCLMDLLGRTGHLDEAVAMLDRLPFQPNDITWISLLSSCQKLGDLNRGRILFNSLKGESENHPAAFVLMSNICEDA